MPVSMTLKSLKLNANSNNKVLLLMQSFTLLSLTETKLVGLSATMRLKNNLSFSLWKEFRSRYNEISNGKLPRLFSVQIYSDSKLSL